MLQNIFGLVRNTFEKMENSRSWAFGIAAGAISIPKWITSDAALIEHGILMMILVAVLFLDYSAGSRLAKKSDVQKKNSKELFECIMRDVLIVLVCVIGWGADKLFSTGAVLYTTVTISFIYQNFYSFTANIAVLGWGEKFPLWLFKWLKDEIDVKKEKYFPGGEK